MSKCLHATTTNTPGHFGKQGSFTYPLLDELEGTLILGHLQQLHGAPLVRGEAAHLTDHVTHKLAVLGQTLKHKISEELDACIRTNSNCGLCSTQQF